MKRKIKIAVIILAVSLIVYSLILNFFYIKPNLANCNEVSKGYFICDVDVNTPFFLYENTSRTNLLGRMVPGGCFIEDTFFDPNFVSGLKSKKLVDPSSTTEYYSFIGLKKGVSYIQVSGTCGLGKIYRLNIGQPSFEKTTQVYTSKIFEVEYPSKWTFIPNKRNLRNDDLSKDEIIYFDKDQRVELVIGCGRLGLDNFANDNVESEKKGGESFFVGTLRGLKNENDLWAYFAKNSQKDDIICIIKGEISGDEAFEQFKNTFSNPRFVY
jgi:hypothetical protein